MLFAETLKSDWAALWPPEPRFIPVIEPRPETLETIFVLIVLVNGEPPIVVVPCIQAKLIPINAPVPIVILLNVLLLTTL